MSLRLFRSFAVGFSWAAALAGCAAGSQTVALDARPPAALPGATDWRYRVYYDGQGQLDVEAAFAATQASTFVLEPAIQRYLRGVSYWRDGVWVNSDLGVFAGVRGFEVPCAQGCQLRYSVRLRDAALALNDVDTAIESGAVLFAPPSSWLLHPAPRSGGELSLRVTTASGSRFVSALRCHAEASGCELRVPTLGVDELSFAAFGALELQELRLGGAHYLLAIAPDKLPLNTAQARTWLHDAVAGLAAYYQGALPAKHALVLLLRGAAGPTRGKTLSRGGPAVLLRAGDEISAQTTRDDWVLTHELLHVNFPDIGRDHAWLSEGLASYVEPIARARAGLLAPAKFWQDLIEGLPEGQPEQGDQGLENTATWGRIYWGGALFCFVADLQIRERTHNQHSLDDVLRAVAATGANVESTMSLPRLWDIGDAATGTRVLHELYERTALRPETTDLDALFQKLGVSLEDGRVRFDDSAPWAETRRLLTDPRSNQDFVPASVTNQEVPRTTP